ncbi:MAG TPA: glycosyltransferase family 4 protein [Oscillatoriaceae cyanobacterium]
MRITVLCPDYPPAPGGVSDYARRWVQALAGEDITVITRPGACEDAGVRLVPHSGWGMSGLGALRRKVLDTRPDVVVLHYVPHLYERRGASLSANLLAWQLRQEGVPVVTIAHELYYGRHEGLRFQPFGLWQRAALWPLFAGSARVVLTVPDRLARMRRFFPRWRARFTLIPVGASFEPRAAEPSWRSRLGLPEGGLLLVFLGLAHPSKELGHLHATLEALSRAGIEARLAIAGGARVDHPRAVNLGFLPESEAASLLASADLVLLPLADGASTRRTSVINALAAGRPVVSTHGANTDGTLLEKGLALVPAHDGAAFAARACALAQDPTAREALGRAGRALYEAEFDWAVLTARWRTLLTEAVQKAGRVGAQGGQPA